MMSDVDQIEWDYSIDTPPPPNKRNWVLKPQKIFSGPSNFENG